MLVSVMKKNKSVYFQLSFIKQMLFLYARQREKNITWSSFWNRRSCDCFKKCKDNANNSKNENRFLWDSAENNFKIGTIKSDCWAGRRIIIDPWVHRHPNRMSLYDIFPKQLQSIISLFLFFFVTKKMLYVVSLKLTSLVVHNLH